MNNKNIDRETLAWHNLMVKKYHMQGGKKVEMRKAVIMAMSIAVALALFVLPVSANAHEQKMETESEVIVIPRSPICPACRVGILRIKHTVTTTSEITRACVHGHAYGQDTQQVVTTVNTEGCDSCSYSREVNSLSSTGPWVCNGYD